MAKELILEERKKGLAKGTVGRRSYEGTFYDTSDNFVNQITEL